MKFTFKDPPKRDFVFFMPISVCPAKVPVTSKLQHPPPLLRAFELIEIFRYLRLKSAVFLNFTSHTQRPLSYKWKKSKVN